MTTIRVSCPNGGELELEVDLRDYIGISPDSRHCGVPCPDCGARLSVPIASIYAAIASGTAAPDAELEPERTAVDAPDPGYIQPPREVDPDPPRRATPTAEEIAARRAAGGGSRGL